MFSVPIETILFDLDGTLRHSVPSADDTQFRIARQQGVVDDPELQVLGARWAHHYWAQSDDLSDDVERFGAYEEAFWINYGYRYLRAMRVSEDRAKDAAPRLMAMMDVEYDPENTVYPCVPETLGVLKDAGYMLGLVSNRSRPCHEECQQLGLLDYFEFAYVAGEVDVWKPNPRIFDRALELTASAPEQVVYVGDNYYADILGAKNAGLQPVLLDEKQIFPEAECLVIERMGDLVDLLIG